MSECVHATAVARWGPQGWSGVLLAGPSGAGKSGLALRLLDLGWRLVGDDYVDVWASQERLFASASERIAGLIEARGVGLVPVRCIRIARVRLLIEGGVGEPERLPEGESRALDGVTIPRLQLDFHHPTAASKVAGALSTVGQRGALS